MNASSTSGDQLLNRCRLLGYRARVGLRLLLAARRDVRAHFVQKDVNDFEAMSIDAENFFLTTVWQRSHKVSDGSFEAWAGPLLAEARNRQVLWACIGDFNATSSEHPMIEETGGCTYSAPRDADGNLLPTRWRSDRCIDWLMISEPDVPIDIWADDAFVGDHRLVWAKIQVPCGFHHAREYKPAVCFRQPLDVEEKTWRQALASEFEDFSDNDLGDAELEWAYLNGELQKRFLPVCDALGRQAPSLQRCRDKGSEVAWFPEGQTTKTWSKRGTFPLAGPGWVSFA